MNGIMRLWVLIPNNRIEQSTMFVFTRPSGAAADSSTADSKVHLGSHANLMY